MTGTEQDVADTTTTLGAAWNGEDGLVVQFNARYLADAYRNLDGPVTSGSRVARSPRC